MSISNFTFSQKNKKICKTKFGIEILGETPMPSIELESLD